VIVAPVETSSRRYRDLLNPISAYVLGVGFVGFAIVLAAPVKSLGDASLGLVVALVALYWIAFNTEFVAWGGSAVPTEPVLIGLLFLVPLRLVPLCVLVAVALPWPFGAPREEVSTLPRLRRAAIKAIGGWHSAGPVLVFMGGDISSATFHRWPVYVLAFVAQYVLEVATALCRLAALRMPASLLVRPMSWTLAVDAMLAPTAVASVAAGASVVGKVLLLAMPVGLMWVLATDRDSQLASTVLARNEARIDPLTGLANRRAWYESFDDMRSAADGSQVITVIIADLDRLKVANDTLGHQVGDELIVAMAKVLRETVPSEAIVARLGGDEYGVAVLGAAPEAAEVLVDDIRRAVDAFPLVSGFRLSASIGAASCPPEADLTQTEREADRQAGLDKAQRRMGRATD
jgi:diguanylate cyclase (GGDEF)-like protein